MWLVTSSKRLKEREEKDLSFRRGGGEGGTQKAPIEMRGQVLVDKGKI